MTQLVKMQMPCGKTADVHPDMIADYQKGGYVVVDEKPKRKTGKSKVSQQTASLIEVSDDNS